MPKPERRAVREVMVTFLLEHFRSISGVLLLVLMSLSVQMGLQLLQDPWRFPLGVVKIQGDFRYLDKARLQDMVEPQLDGGFFTVDVARVCEVIESMPWVASATVKRIWPDRLRVRVTEQLPVARWGENGYLNERGEPFVPEPTQVAGDLPALAGPDGHEATVLEQYRAMSHALAPTGLRVAGEFERDANFAGAGADRARSGRIARGEPFHLGEQSLLSGRPRLQRLGFQGQLHQP